MRRSKLSTKIEERGDTSILTGMQIDNFQRAIIPFSSEQLDTFYKVIFKQSIFKEGPRHFSASSKYQTDTQAGVRPGPETM